MILVDVVATWVPLMTALKGAAFHLHHLGLPSAAREAHIRRVEAVSKRKRAQTRCSILVVTNGS